MCPIDWKILLWSSRLCLLSNPLSKILCLIRFSYIAREKMNQQSVWVFLLVWDLFPTIEDQTGLLPGCKLMASVSLVVQGSPRRLGIYRTEFLTLQSWGSHPRLGILSHSGYMQSPILSILHFNITFSGNLLLGAELCPPKSICWSPNPQPQCPRKLLYLEVRPLKPYVLLSSQASGLSWF